MQSTMQPVPLLLSRILEYGTSVFPDAEVVTWTGAEPRRQSYRELGLDCRRLAGALRTLGVDGDQRVATFMWNNAEHLALYLTVPSMGAVLHTINIRLFPQQMVYVVNHAQDHVVVVDASLAAPFAKVLAHCPTVRHVVVNGEVPEPVRAELAGDGAREVHDYRSLLDAQPAQFTWPELDENTAAAMCYTSGTTGNPKGVVYSHRSNYLHTLQIALPVVFDVRQGDRLLAIVPMFHANAWGLPYVALMCGATLVQPDRFLQAEPLVTMIEQEKVTGGGGVPTIWADVLRYLKEHPERDISSVRRLIVGGSACPRSVFEGYDELGIQLVHAWGMTETSPVGSVALPPPHAQGEEAMAYRVSQGRLACPVEGRLVGPDGAQLPWDGQSVGELEVRGPWITGSYYAPAGSPPEPEDEWKFDDGWLRTGDVGSLTDEGFLSLSDRAKDVIKSGGEWISSVELENHLMDHPAVLEASVVGVPDERWGERPLASVVLAEGQQVDAGQLREFLAERVAKWQVPERWAFIDAVPKTSVGKFDKKVLRSRYAKGELEVTTLT